MVADRLDGFEIEAAFQGGRHFMHAAVAQVGAGDDIETAPRMHARVAAQFGDHQLLFRHQRDEHILHLGRAARDLFEAHQLARLHRLEQRRRHQRAPARPFGQQQRVVPRILDMVFGGAGRALDRQRRIAADGGGQQFGQQRLGRTRLAHQHQALVAHQGDDGAVDQRIVAIELAAHLQRRVAEDKAAHGARRQLPALGARIGIGRLQPFEFARMTLFGAAAYRMFVLVFSVMFSLA